MKIFVRVVALLLLSLLVFGDSFVTFTLFAPTNRVDETQLEFSELDYYTVQCGTTANGPYDVFKFEQQGTQQAMEIIRDVKMPVGIYYCVATVTDTNGLESDHSNEIHFTLSSPRTKNPGCLF